MQEQLRDLTFHFEAQLKIAGAGGEGSAAELGGGDVELPTTPGSARRGKRKTGSAKKG